MKINLVRRNDSSFIPASEDDKQAALKIKKGQAVEVSVKVLRNYKLLRKFFSMLNTAWEFLDEAQQEYFNNSKEVFRAVLTSEAGYCDRVYSKTRGEWIDIPKSIAFDKMDEAEFDKLYEDVVNVVFKLFLPHVDRDEFYNAMKDF